MRYAKHLWLALVIAILLAGCGGGTASTTTTKPTTAATASAITPVPQKPGSLKITFWYGLGGHNGDVVQMLINQYNLSQNKYYVQGVFQSSYDDTLSKVNAATASQSLPNVVQIYDVGTQRMVDTKKIVPVQDLIARDNLQSVVDDIEPAIRSYYTINGKLQSMPFNSSTAVMYFDKNAFRQAGLDPNQKAWTYDQVLAAAQKLTVKDASGKITRASVGLYGYAWLLEEEEAIYNALHATPDNGRTSRATKYTFNNAASVQYLDFMKKLLDNGTATYFGSNGTPAQNAADAAFLSGKTAINFASIANLRGYLTTAQKNGGKPDVGVAYLPRAAGAAGRNIIGGASLWVTNTGTADQQAGAWDFIKFAVQPESQAFWSSNTGYVPVRLSAYTLPDMKATLAKYPQFQAAIDQIRAAPTSNFDAGCVAGNMLTARNNIQQSMDDYLSGRVSSAQTALDSAAQKSNDDLDEYNAANQ
jgi:sn-glycerol 3-phosphate transport system substrate-binding protein